MWTIQLLGGLAAHSPQRQLTRFRTQKAASLLAFLAFHLAPQPRETLLDLLWPDADIDTGRHNLSNALSFLRHQLEPPGVPPGTVILADRASVRLNPQAVSTDVADFEAAMRQAGQAGISEAERVGLLEQAARVYQGPLLPGFYEEWIVSEALRLTSLFVQGVVSLVPLLVGAGRAETAVGYARRAVSADPLSEEAMQSLMQALSASGQAGQALRAYRQLETRFQEELDAQPSPALQHLAEQLGQSDALRTPQVLPEGSPSAEESVSIPRPGPNRSEPASQAVVSERVGAAPRGRLVGGEFLLRSTTRFFGREEEVSRLEEMLSTPRNRLVTLTGPGGTGKTRLALEAAAHLVETAAPAALTTAVFVPLAEISDAERLFDTTLRSLGIVPASNQDPLDQLAHALDSGSDTLLVLDNCEQLGEVGALRVHDLLATAATVKLLVTSRQKLHIEGEHEFHLAPLPISTGTQTLEALLAVPSVALFVDRAQSVLPDFQLTERNAATIAQLCDYLEGFPLAIELAAARVGVLSPARILEQVQANRLDFLATRRRDASSRQRTLRSTLDWSYQLLPQAGQSALSSLSVFRGGWTLEAAEAVCGSSEAETLELSMLLRDSSLIKVTDTREGMRFSMLETVREYSQAKLRESGEEGVARGRHRDHCAALLEQAEPELTGPEQGMWMERLQTEQDNLCAALNWCETEAASAQVGLWLVGALSRFWEVRGYLSLGRGYLARALSRAEASAPTADRAKALRGAGWLAFRQGDYASARTLYEQSLAISRELGDKGDIAQSLGGLGVVANSQGDYEAARTLLQESLAIKQELRDQRGIAQTLNNLGTVACDQSDYEAARVLYEESLAISRELRDKGGIAYALDSLGVVASYQGDYGAARTLYEQSLEIRRELGDKGGIAYAFYSLGGVAHAQGDQDAARMLIEQSLEIRRELGDKGGIALSLNGLGYVAFEQGDYETSRKRLQESLTLYREIGHTFVFHVLGLLGHVEREVGDYGRASALYQESLRMSRETGNVLYIAQSLEDLAGLEGRHGQFERAVRLLGAAEALCKTMGRPLPAGDAPEYERTVEAARAALSEESFAAIWEAGRAMTLEQAVVYALSGE